MRIAQINMVHFGSTGKIMFQIAKTARDYGYEMRTFSTYLVAKHRIELPTAPEGHTYYGSRIGNGIHRLLAFMTGRNGFYSRFSTWQLIRKIRAFNPDILHLHNLQWGYLNLPVLFRFCKRADIHIIWTLHDCWAMTGCCPYFTLCNCDKWKEGCRDCPQWKKAVVGPDRSNQIWKKKKKVFTSVEKLTLVTPSYWLADIAHESFLKEYSIKVINNGIDLSVFKPMSSDWRTKWHCEDKFILLGVSFAWGKRKGLDVFIDLAKQLDDRFQIVLVGTNEQIEEMLPPNIISIQRTENQKELAEIYSTADLFVNPTREENYPTVNMEALACGTPVLTFRTGGSPENVDETCGCVVNCDDLQKLRDEIIRIQCTRPYPTEACLKRAKAFDMYERFDEYVQLYGECV